MGNKFSKRRAVVDERYTRTQGLYHHKDVDPRKLRRLILNGQLAPCFPGAEDSALELDECPICFLFYPSLNRSKCCAKGICTECFLQIKSPQSTRPTQCPFCKTPSYVVEYRGAKTVEEKGVEQEEEQRVIEAKIRIRQKELHEEEQRLVRNEEYQVPQTVPERFRRNFSNLHGFTLPSEDVQLHDGQTGTGQDMIVGTDSNLPVESSQAPAVAQGTTEPVLEGGDYTASQASRTHASSFQRISRTDDFDMDLEDIMVIEAIWLSIQEQGRTQFDQTNLPRISNSSSALDENSTARNMLENGTMIGRGSVTSGLAGAIAALAEMQATSSENNVMGVRVPDNNVQGLELEPRLLHSSNEDCNEVVSNGNVLPQTMPAMGIRVDTEEKVNQDGKFDTGYAVNESGNRGQELNNWIEVAVENERAILPPTGGESRSSTSDCLQDQSSEAVEVGTSFSSSVPSDLPWEAPDVFPVQSAESINDEPGLTQSMVILPDRFEEQMMLAVALSLAEAQAQARRQ